MKIASNNMTIADYIKSEVPKDSKVEERNRLLAQEKRKALHIINDIGEKNPYAVIDIYENYLISNPFDYISSAYYISALIKIGELDKAELELKYLISEYARIIKKYNSNYSINNFEDQGKEGFLFKDLPENIQKIWENIVFTKFKLLCNQGKTKEALLYYFQHYKFLSGDNSRNIHNSIIFYLKHKNGVFDQREMHTDSYLFNQILKYNENDLIEHTKKMQEKQGRWCDSKNISYFSIDFPFDLVYEKVKEYISDVKKLNMGLMEDTYIFRCDNCGVANGKIVNFFKVITFKDTYDIFAIAPVEGFYELPEYYDFTEFIKGGEVKKK